MKRRWILFSKIGLSLILTIGLTLACQEQVGQNETPLVNLNTPTQPTSTAPAADTLPPTQTATIARVDLIREMIGQVNPDRALTDLKRLSGELPICNGNDCHTIANRLTGSEGLHWAEDYIYSILTSLGYAVEISPWSSSGYSDENIIATKPGSDASSGEIYIVAHMDGVQSGDEDRFPAADDNASGDVALLELARVASNHTFSHSLVLFFSSGEEEGELGVQSYLNQLSQQDLSLIKDVVDVDMIGYDANQDHVMELWYGDHAPSLALAQMMSQTITDYQIDLSPGFIVGCG